MDLYNVSDDSRAEILSIMGLNIHGSILAEDTLLSWMTSKVSSAVSCSSCCGAFAEQVYRHQFHWSFGLKMYGSTLAEDTLLSWMTSKVSSAANCSSCCGAFAGTSVSESISLEFWFQFLTYMIKIRGVILVLEPEWIRYNRHSTSSKGTIERVSSNPVFKVYLQTDAIHFSPQDNYCCI